MSLIVSIKYCKKPAAISADDDGSEVFGNINQLENILKVCSQEH